VLSTDTVRNGQKPSYDLNTQATMPTKGNTHKTTQAFLFVRAAVLEHIAGRVTTSSA